MKYFLCLPFLCLVSSLLTAQVTITKEWAIDLPNANFDKLHYGKDNHIYLLGNDAPLQDGSFTNLRTHTAKIDTTGLIIWQHNYIEPMPNNFAFQLHETMCTIEGNSLVALNQQLDEDRGERGVLLNKNNTNGDILWRKEYYNELLGNYSHGRISIIGTDSQQYVYLLKTKDSIWLNNHFYIEKLNPITGETIWELSYEDSTQYNPPYGVIIQNDKLYAFGFSQMNDRFYFLRINTQGQQEKQSAMPFIWGVSDFKLDNEGNFYLYNDANEHDNRIIKVIPFESNVPSIAWTYSYTAHNDTIASIADFFITDNNEIYVAAYLSLLPTFSIKAMIITKLDTNMELKWSNKIMLTPQRFYPRRIAAQQQAVGIMCTAFGTNGITRPKVLFYDKNGLFLDSLTHQIPHGYSNSFDIFNVADNFYTIDVNSPTIVIPDYYSTLTRYRVTGTPVGTHIPFGGLNTLTVLPNPATAQVQLQFGEAVPQARVRLYTLEGRQVGGEQVVSNAVHTIEVAHLPKGMYWVQVYTDAGLYATQKVVVQ